VRGKSELELQEMLKECSVGPCALVEVDPLEPKLKDIELAEVRFNR